ncbi:phosphatidylinositol N-acetylglucosaminyltransferase GPI15 Ecym_3319 [Eremothecium cymbalariae DBVPG|uniref:Phosphatidylinositol N-acetylglucosaminyltransferase subunit H conserved domain-containing protein n=1 Tax=Eremothecium cymbalariae (strain CBS 270.75 / DBVPG 7215 / KCTC 17166 / NRRL Y-17582) TaxID=931890 RepID=G8JRP1_ERECY|nr:Hypothetical protein Ecym_3319 [Eremothecium cymbalariae DBVPG\
MNLNIERDLTGFCIKFEVRPVNFFMLRIMKLCIWILLQILGYFLIHYISLREKVIFVKILFSSITLFLIRTPTIDSFYVFRDYGIQISTTRGCVLLPQKLNDVLFETKTFIPTDEIVDVVINEGIQGFSVIFYLCAIVKRSKKLHIIFPVCISTYPKILRGIFY